jgi:hypothetical protein
MSVIWSENVLRGVASVARRVSKLAKQIGDFVVSNMPLQLRNQPGQVLDAND